MKKTVIILSALALIAVSCRVQKNTAVRDKGVKINGIVWSTCNVGSPGIFVSNPKDYGNFYTWEEAQTVCPQGWRLPTSDEQKSLIEAGSKWKTAPVNGRIFGSGRNSIFLPAAGYRTLNDKHGLAGEQGRYWSSSPDPSDYAWVLCIDDSSVSNKCNSYKNFGESVRCVRQENEEATPALLPAVLQTQETVSTQTAEARSKEISVLDGTVILEISEGTDFPCIGMHFGDKNLNRGFGTYMEIKKRGEFYIMYQWKGKEYANMNEGIEDVLKEHFISFYEGQKQEERGEEVWSAFVNEGGLQSFIDFVNEIIDDGFLNSPFNETYG